MTNRITYRCPHCGGQDCGWDAYAVWDDAAQMMALGGAYDGMWCSDCGELKSLDLVPLAEQPVLTRPMLLKVLDLSTGHVTKEVMDRLYDPQGNWPFSIKTDPYGCFLSVPDVVTDPADIPPSLAQCFQYARSIGAVYIHFDRDARRDETLPFYPW